MELIIECIDKQDLFPCYSPLFKSFLEQEKLIIHIDEKTNKINGKTCWYFIKSIRFYNALIEWRIRKESDNKYYQRR